MSDETDAVSPADRVDAAGRMPPATFEFLIHTLFMQALMAFGRIPNPITNKAVKNVATAKHFIDTLDMLEAKTKGNLTGDEQKLLEESQHKLRLLYVGEQG